MKAKMALALVAAAFAISACATTGGANVGNHEDSDFTNAVQYQMGNGTKVEMTGSAVSCGSNQKSHSGAETFKATKPDGQVRTGVVCHQDGTTKVSFDPK